MKSQTIFADFDPNDHLVGTLQLVEKRLDDGIHEVARDEKSGVTLWAKIHQGLPVCFRGTDRSGHLLETVTIFRPEHGVSVELNPKGSPPEEAFQTMLMPDGGYVCTAQGNDGGYTCWKP